MIASDAEAEDALSYLRQLTLGRSAAGASRTTGACIRPRVRASFRTEHPGVELALQVENTQAIEDKLIAGEIDIGFAEGIIRSDILDYQVFAQDELEIGRASCRERVCQYV